MLERINMDTVMAELEERHTREIDQLNLRRELVKIANQVALDFWKEDESRDLSMNMAFGIHTHESTAIDFRLKKGQHIEDVKPLLKLVAQTRCFHPAVETDYLEMGWVGWKFKEKGDAPADTLLIRVWFGASQVCRLEPTGKMEPVMKVVCEPSVTFDQPRSEA